MHPKEVTMFATQHLWLHQARHDQLLREARQARLVHEAEQARAGTPATSWLTTTLHRLLDWAQLRHPLAGPQGS
jgi:hypothetical protein